MDWELFIAEAKQKTEEFHRLGEEWESGKASRGTCLTHAVLQGGYAAEIESAKPKDNPYSIGSDWRWAWMTGFDLGRRIDRANKQRRAFAEFISEVAPHIPGDTKITLRQVEVFFDALDLAKESPPQLQGIGSEEGE